jgi:hypothetical protein
MQLHQRRIANELDRIAHALFRVEQDRLSRQRLSTPQRLGKAARRQVPRLPPPFVFRPTPLPIAGVKASARAQHVRLGVVRLYFQSPLGQCDRFFKFPLAHQQDAQVDVRLGVVRLQLQHPAAANQRLVELALGV